MGNTIPTTVRIPEELKNLINIILQSYVNEDKAK